MSVPFGKIGDACCEFEWENVWMLSVQTQFSWWATNTMVVEVNAESKKKFFFLNLNTKKMLKIKYCTYSSNESLRIMNNPSFLATKRCFNYMLHVINDLQPLANTLLIRPMACIHWLLKNGYLNQQKYFFNILWHKRKHSNTNLYFSKLLSNSMQYRK